MNVVRQPEQAAARIATAIGEPARARMLYCLLDDRARTGTELALVAGVSPSTASVHLHRLCHDGLVRVLVQGKHRYYSLHGPDVAAVLEGLTVLAAGSSAGGGRDVGETRGASGASGAFVPNTPNPLRAARTCYDHAAGTLGVVLHDRLAALSWIAPTSTGGDGAYDLTARGEHALVALGVDVADARAARRRLAYACVDWSERRPHLGGALGAALLTLMRRKRWVTPERDSRALNVTTTGRRELRARLGVRV